jgi:DNA modification methylase
MADTDTAAATWEPIDSLVPWDKNPRKYETQPVAEVAESIRRYGFGAPLVAREADRVLIAGHTRLRAAQSLGMTQVPVRFLDVTEQQAHALALADNRLGELAKWDNVAVGGVLAELMAQDFPIDAIGWTERDTEALRGFATRAAADEPPEPREPNHTDPVSVAGGVYRLGQHVLVCGDATLPATWDLVDGVRGGATYDLVWTDPPYGISYRSLGRSVSDIGGVAERARRADKVSEHQLNPRGGRHGQDRPSTEKAVRKAERFETEIENDELSPAELEPFLRAVFGPAYERTTDGGSWYVAGPSGPARHAFGVVLTELPTLWRHTLIWLKDQFVFGRSDRHYQHEALFYGWKDGAPHVWNGGRARTSVIHCPRPKRADEHPTMKPVELVEECLVTHRTGTPALVLDPFGGSGTTLLAAARLGMTCHLIELSPGYCDVIRTRWGEYAIANGVEPGPDALFPTNG